MNIYDQIKHDIAQEYYQNNYSNDGQRFVAWYLRNIYGLNTAIAKSCITDGAGDKQIDAVYINEQEQTIYIVQGKFVQKGKLDSKPLMEIHSAWLQLKDPQHLQENANDALAGKVNAISQCLDEGYDICFELITNSELSKQAQKDLEIYRREFEDCDTLNASLKVLDINSLNTLYNEFLNKRSNINHDFTLEQGRYMEVNVSGKKAVIAVISLRECLNIPGIQDGSLFRKNVRQSLGKGLKVNKEIADSLRNNPGEFFFLNNGITAICSSINIHDGVMSAKDMSVVNGCQSLTTIFNNGESLRNSEGGYIVFRFYEIAENEKADMISTSTNTQNRVSARDLCSNDKHVLAIKRDYEHCYTDGQFITKRGETHEAGKNPLHIIDLGILGKLLLSWYLQKPTGVNDETKIFGKESFKQLFHRQYTLEKIQALNEIYMAILKVWETKDNPLEFNDTLFARKKRALFFHVFAVSALFCVVNKSQDNTIPPPDIALTLMKDGGILDEVVQVSGDCVNEACMSAADEAKEKDEIFDILKWLKSASAITAVRSEIRKAFRPHKQDDTIADLKEKLKMSKRDFEPVHIGS